MNENPGALFDSMLTFINPCFGLQTSAESVINENESRPMALAAGSAGNLLS